MRQEANAIRECLSKAYIRTCMCVTVRLCVCVSVCNINAKRANQAKCAKIGNKKSTKGEERI